MMMTEIRVEDTGTRDFESGPRMPREPDDREERAAARALFWKRVGLGAAVTALLMVIVGGASTLYLIRQTQKANLMTLHRMEDCTTPGRECYERGQRSTGGAVAGINTITVRATACLAVVLKQIPDNGAVPVDDVARKIQRCIADSTVNVKPQKIVPAPREPDEGPTTRSRSDATPESSPRPAKAPTSAPSVVTPSPKASTPTDAPPLVCVLRVCVADPLLGMFLLSAAIES